MAPSWSWLSVTCIIDLLTLYNDYYKLIFEVVDILVILKGRGILGPAVCQETASHRWDFQMICGREIEDEEFQNIYMDHSTGCSERELVYLPVIDVRIFDEVIGLVLEHSQEQR